MEAVPRNTWTEEQKAQLVADIVSGALSVRRACEIHELTPERIAEWANIYRRTVRDAIDDKLTRTLRRQGIETGALDAAEFNGPLGELSIADLLQTIEMGRKDGVITVKRDGAESRIWCGDGNVLDAESGQLKGVAAVYRILGLERGNVTARFHPVTRPRQIVASTQGILLEAARRKDESDVLKSNLGGRCVGYALSYGVVVPEGDPEEAAIARLCDGTRALADVVEHSPIGDLETLAIVTRLLERGTLLSVGTVASSAVSAQRLHLEADCSPERRSLSAGVRLSIPSGGPAGAASVQPPQRAGSKSNRTWIIAGLAIVVGAAAAVFASSRPAPDPASLGAGAPVRAPASAAATPHEAPAPRLFRVQTRTEPEQAELWLDGRLLGTGSASAQLPVDGSQHELRVAADGYTPYTLHFVDAAPPALVRLQAQAQPAAEEAQAERPAEPPQEVPRPTRPAHATSTRVAHANTPAQPAPHAEPAPVATPTAAPTKALPQVKIINDDAPRVRIVE